MQRSGTSVTLDCLAGHPQVAVCPEEIHTALFATALPRGTNEPPASDRTQDLLAIFDHLAGRREDRAVVGLKTALPTVEHTARLVGCLRTHLPELDLIVVRRGDLVAQFGSLRRARSIGKWHRQSGEPRPDASTMVHFTAEELDDYVRRTVRCHRLLQVAARGRRVLELDYEQDIVTGRAWPRLFAFLAIDDLAPDWLTLRKSSPEPASFIADYADHAARLPGLLAASEAEPAPTVTFATAESRLFLLHRAQLRRRAGDDVAAITDAVAALAAPPDWGVEDRSWACTTIRDALFRLGDPARALAVRDSLLRDHPTDAEVLALAAQIDAHLGDA